MLAMCVGRGSIVSKKTKMNDRPSLVAQQTAQQRHDEHTIEALRTARAVFVSPNVVTLGEVWHILLLSTSSSPSSSSPSSIFLLVLVLLLLLMLFHLLLWQILLTTSYDAVHLQNRGFKTRWMTCHARPKP